jgi:hypothetical protein
MSVQHEIPLWSAGDLQSLEDVARAKITPLHDTLGRYFGCQDLKASCITATARTGDPVPPRIRRGKRFIFIGFLLRIRGVTGSPVMAVALVE